VKKTVGKHLCLRKYGNRFGQLIVRRNHHYPRSQVESGGKGKSTKYTLKLEGRDESSPPVGAGGLPFAPKLNQKFHHVRRRGITHLSVNRQRKGGGKGAKRENRVEDSMVSENSPIRTWTRYGGRDVKKRTGQHAQTGEERGSETLIPLHDAVFPTQLLQAGGRVADWWKTEHETAPSDHPRGGTLVRVGESREALRCAEKERKSSRVAPGSEKR